MESYHPLVSNNDAQIITMQSGFNGYQFARIGFASAPSAGTVKLESRVNGSQAWTLITQGVSVTSGEVAFQFEGAVNALRVTFTGLTGGISPAIWVSSQPSAIPPLNLMTDGGTGPNRRLRVDTGQTGFFAGKFFRSYLNAVIPTAGPTVQFRFTSPIDFILWSQVLELTQGAIELRVYSGGTPSGTWTQRPIIGVNRMAQRPQPYYTSQCTFETGGNFTGGTEVDLLQIRTAAANNTASNVGGTVQERGLPAGVYFGRFQTLTGGLTVNDAAQLNYSLSWEERP